MKMDLVKQLMNEFVASDVFKMKIEIEDLKLELEKAPMNVEVVTQVAPVVAPVQPAAPVATPVVEAPAMPSGTPVNSPIVGVFYPSSSPTAAPYVEVGATVKKGQVLCIVEAMKVMNEIKAPIDGTVTAILANADDLVEFNQALMIIEG